MTAHPKPQRSFAKFRDLGFGSVVADTTWRRLINRDGSFNVKRRGLPWRSSFSLFNDLVVMTWPMFIGLVTVFYLAVNALFAVVYLALGPGTLVGSAGPGLGERALEAFFFSVHTFSTVGYGHIVPSTLAANIVVTFEAIIELFIVALATGLVLARFSRPVARIRYSKQAIVAPYEGGEAFMFRIANMRKSEILNLNAKVIFTQIVEENGRRRRNFVELPLERHSVTFFPLTWTVVHPIDESSPLWDLDRDACNDSDVEILVLLEGMDDTLSDSVHSRMSYKGDEIEWGARFESVIQMPPTAEEPLSADISRIDETVSIERREPTP